ncbi:MAG: ATP phosphoribosyltransferase regulatory subunit [Solirubrobacterales bacterium]|nr:ATP phosphoribosyltransferase regulatory subunit [Solirubrobacterales bacterium]
MQTHLRANQDKLSAEVKGRIDINPLRAFDSADPSTQEVMATAPVLLDSLDPQDAEHFQVVRDLLDAAGVAYEVDPRLVRGLDYYGRTVFEFSSDRLGAQSGVGGGGRYDGLMELLGGQATPGIGWAAGVERILLAREPQDEAQPKCDLLVVALESDRLTDAFVLAKLARGQGIEARLEVTGRSVKAALKHANKIGALAVALLDSAGDQLKNMDTGEQVVQESATTLLESLRGMMV